MVSLTERFSLLRGSCSCDFIALIQVSDTRPRLHCCFCSWTEDNGSSVEQRTHSAREKSSVAPNIIDQRDEPDD
jgi:hypothetical protein